MMEINAALCLSLAPCSNQNSNFLFSFVSIFFFIIQSVFYIVHWALLIIITAA